MRPAHHLHRFILCEVSAAQRPWRAASRRGRVPPAPARAVIPASWLQAFARAKHRCLKARGCFHVSCVDAPPNHWHTRPGECRFNYSQKFLFTNSCVYTTIRKWTYFCECPRLRFIPQKRLIFRADLELKRHGVKAVVLRTRRSGGEPRVKAQRPRHGKQRTTVRGFTRGSRTLMKCNPDGLPRPAG